MSGALNGYTGIYREGRENMRQSFRTGMHYDGLREKDRIIRSILLRYPHPPRIVHDVWYPVRNVAYFVRICVSLFLLVIYIIIAPYLWGLIQTGEIWRFWRGIEALLTAPVMVFLVLYILIEPLYSWNFGLGKGRVAVATITMIKSRPTTRSVEGKWEVTINASQFQSKFYEFALEDDTWVQDLREGDRIRVLLHPTKDKVLLAYGPG